MSTTQETLKKIFDNHEVPLPSGNTIALKKVTVRSLKPVIDLLSKVMESLKLDGENIPTLNIGGSPDVILKLISNHYDDVVKLVPLLADIELADMYELDPADALTLVQAIILLNQDFFTKTVLPTLSLSKEIRANAVS